MKLLNSKSILDCDEDEEELHNKELINFLNLIFLMQNYECAIIYKFKDVAHQEKKDIIKQCYLHNVMDMIEYVDIKNGIDFAIDDNGIFVIIAYGNGYEFKKKYYFNEVHIHIMPYNEDREFINVFKGLKWEINH